MERRLDTKIGSQKKPGLFIRPGFFVGVYPESRMHTQTESVSTGSFYFNELMYAAIFNPSALETWGIGGISVA